MALPYSIVGLEACLSPPCGRFNGRRKPKRSTPPNVQSTTNTLRLIPRMIPRIEAWKIGRIGEISNAMNSFGEVVPRGGLSGDASEASKINNLTSPQYSRLYQENVLCRLRMMGTSNLNFMARLR